MKKIFSSVELFSSVRHCLLAAVVFCGTGALASCGSDDDDTVQPTPQPQERRISFEGILNARDMGGLVMQDGRTVSFGKLLRSANLAKATDADAALLTNKYHLSDVFDFRLDMEAAAAPDREMEGVTYTHLSTLPIAEMMAEAEEAGLDVSTLSGMLSGDTEEEVMMKVAFSPQAQAMAKNLYPAIVTNTDSQKKYGDFLRGVLKAKGGVLWHCSEGKDRAGWGAAFVLAALGASRDVIVQDFNISNEAYAAQVQALTSMVPQVEGAEGAIAFIRAIVGVSRENFEATLDLIDKNYGSMAQYMEKQLGFTAAEQQQLRDKYLK